MKWTDPEINNLPIHSPRIRGVSSAFKKISGREGENTHPVTRVALRDGHVRHDIPVVTVPQRRGPLADDHLRRLQGQQGLPANVHWVVVSSSTLSEKNGEAKKSTLK